jgi:hypothetical protein
MIRSIRFQKIASEKSGNDFWKETAAACALCDYVNLHPARLHLSLLLYDKTPPSTSTYKNPPQSRRAAVAPPRVFP